MKPQSTFWILASLILLIIFTGVLYWYNHVGSSDPQVNFSPQKTQLFSVGQNGDNPLNVLATTLPQFAIKLADAKFKNLWQANAQERKTAINAEVSNVKKDASLSVNTTFNDEQKELIVTPQIANKVKPGLYTLNIKIKTISGEDVTITQNFSWGVLAINTDKGTYTLGQTVNIGMAVLDDTGSTKCIAKPGVPLLFSGARVRLLITSPSGQKQQLSSDDGTISGSKDCADRSFTYKPDFSTTTQAQEIGKYTLHMEADTMLGTKSIDESFTVSSNEQSFIVERTQFPTRIYPRLPYPVQMTVTANKDYSGSVVDVVPSSFLITNISDNGITHNKEEYQTIVWQVNWQKGQTYNLGYTIKFPPVAPEFYLVGPLHIGNDSEGREWQIASDSIFNLEQEIHNTGSSVTTISVTPTTPVSGHLLILICERPDNNTFRSPTGGGSGSWTAITNSSNLPRLYWYYKLAPATGWTVPNCRATTGGELTIQMLEFSGNSTSGVADSHTTILNSTACNTGANQIITNARTPTNPDELVIGAFAAAKGNLTYTNNTTIAGGSSSGFDDILSGGFHTSNGSYYSSWGEAVNNPAVSQTETVTLSSTGTRCSGDLAFFNPTITVSQGSFQFFDNINSINPATTFGSGATAENTNIALNQPNQSFRVRMLLDIDSPTTSLALQTGDFILQYATLSAGLTCATASYDLVSTPLSQSAIAFYQNAFTTTSGGNISATGSDPSDTPTYTTEVESYYQDDTSSDGPTGGGSPGDVTNDQLAIANNQAGLWDFSLIDNTDDSISQTYCLRLANSGGTDLSAYRSIPQVTTIHNDVVIRGSPNTTVIKGSPGSNGTSIQ